jgi:plastocyanin
MMIPQRYSRPMKMMLAALAASILLAAPGADAQEKAKRPKLSVRSSPMMVFTPATITVTAELKGGDDDFEEYYCGDVEWDWDDGTRSESSDDCEPYEAGKSEIRRRFSVQHRYNLPGTYDVQFRLKQRGKVVANARTKVTVRSHR